MRTITIGGKHYEIHYGQNAICALEDALYTPIFKLTERITAGEDIGFREIRALLWAGMLAKRRNLTLEMVGTLLDGGDAAMNDILFECGAELFTSLERMIKNKDDGDAQEDDSKNA